MTKFIFYDNPTLTLVCVPSPAPLLHSLETSARLTGLHPEMLRYYCRTGLIAAHVGEGEGEPVFDDEALEDVRRIEHYRQHLGVGRRALPLVCELWREGERQQIELRFLRCP